MSKKTGRILIAILFVTLVLPSILYFVVNGYWWLFDGDMPISEKMGAAFSIGSIGLVVLAFALWVSETEL